MKYLQCSNRQLPFLITHRDFNYFTKYYRQFSFNEVDPLLGWARSTNSIVADGYIVKNNCVFLNKSDSGIIIFITGGSTSDVVLNRQNWPTHLQRLLTENNISATLVVGAVGGYNSGQELLKTIRDGANCHPFVHVSYSGANDVEYSGYVSPYEYSAFKEMINGGSVPPYLANTITVARNLLAQAPGQLYLKENEPEQPLVYFSRNMNMMHALSVGLNYRFIGILQPVINSGIYKQPETEAANDFHAPLYKKYYPGLKAYAANTPFMVSFTNLFDTCSGPVFVDDCHVQDEYQNLIAIKVFEELLSRKFISVGL